MHFTPMYSSWINEGERFFANVIVDLLQHSDHRSVQVLEPEVRKWIKDWNSNPSSDFYNELPAQNTSPALCPVRLRL